VADVLKILIKEIIQINKVDKFLFYAAPFFMIVASVLTFGAIPFGKVYRQSILILAFFM